MTENEEIGRSHLHGMVTILMSAEFLATQESINYATINILVDQLNIALKKFKESGRKVPSRIAKYFDN